MPCVSYADTFEPNASYSVCFTPDGNCTQQIVDAVNGSVRNIWVQAYSFTSRPIAKALITAKQRGVNVQIIFDKDILQQGNGVLNNFAQQNIPIWIDEQPAIAHNKVMVIDQTRTVTGSFNFTRAAQQKNAENVIIINDASVAKKYLQNWQQRQQVSTVYNNQASTNNRTTVAPIQDDWLSDLWEWLVNLFRHLF